MTGTLTRCRKGATNHGYLIPIEGQSGEPYTAVIPDGSS